MTTKKQFTTMYEQSVDLLKNFKQSNDRLNKSIGVETDSTISLKLKSEEYSYNNTLTKLDELIEKLQQSYLDPDTARKIGTVKQQYRIQKDRRAHLMQSVELQNLQMKEEKQSSTNQFINNYNQGQSSPNSNKKRTPDRRQEKHNFQSQITNTSIHQTISSSKMQQQQLIGYDYQIQCKMMNQKSKAINQVQKSILNVYSITQQTAQMVHEQGQNIDIIGDQIFTSYKNMKDANEQLGEASQHQKRAKGKYAVISVVLILAIIAAFAVFVL